MTTHVVQETECDWSEFCYTDDPLCGRLVNNRPTGLGGLLKHATQPREITFSSGVAELFDLILVWRDPKFV